MRLRIPEATYFISKTTSDNKATLTQEKIATIVINAFKYISLNKHAHIHSYVLMPTHYHMIISLNDHEDISRIIHSINSYTAHQISKLIHQKSIWDNITWDEVIRNEEMYYQKLAYILLNPWRKRIVKSPFDPYQYSNLEEICKLYGKEYLVDLFERYKRFGE